MPANWICEILSIGILFKTILYTFLHIFKLNLLITFNYRLLNSASYNKQYKSSNIQKTDDWNGCGFEIAQTWKTCRTVVLTERWNNCFDECETENKRPARDYETNCITSSEASIRMMDWCELINAQKEQRYCNGQTIYHRNYSWSKIYSFP